MGMKELELKFKSIEKKSKNVKETKERLMMGHEDPLLNRASQSKYNFEESKVNSEGKDKNNHFKHWKWEWSIQTNIEDDIGETSSRLIHNNDAPISEHQSTNWDYLNQNISYFLILTCKKLKSIIEDTYNIEFMLENNSLITKEMEYYAQIYEIEYTLREESININLEWISRILDSISHDWMVQSNIYFQQEYIKYKILKEGEDADISLVFPLEEGQSYSLYDSQVLVLQATKISLFLKLE